MEKEKIEKLPTKLILTHYPTILTQDKNWAEKVSQRPIKEAEIILLPPDAILVAHPKDREIVQLYNTPMFIYEETKENN